MNEELSSGKIDKTEMKNELKQFFNDLTQNKPGNIPEGNMFTSSSWPPATF